MRKTVRKQMKKVFCAVLCGGMLLAGNVSAMAATEAVFEYDVERGEGKVYLGIVSTSGLNVRTGPGKGNPIVQSDEKDVVLDNKDQVAILEQAISSGEVWYKVSFRRDGSILVGYVHSKYVDQQTDVITPLATPTPVPTFTPTPKPATPTPTIVPVTPTQAPKQSTEKENGDGGMFAIVAVVLIGAGILVALWYLKKRSDEENGNEAKEKLENLKKTSLPHGPLSADGTPIPVMKRREIPENHEEEEKHYPLERQDEATLLADKERARLMNEEMIRRSRNGEDEEEDAKLREIAASLKEKEVLKVEIDRLRIGDMVFHEYFGKGIVRDNSDVKVIEISFGQDVRFLNKAACASKRLLRKL